MAHCICTANTLLLNSPGHTCKCTAVHQTDTEAAAADLCAKKERGMSKKVAAENDWFVWLCVHPESSTKIHLLEAAAENNCVHVSGQDKTIIFFPPK